MTCSRLDSVDAVLSEVRDCLRSGPLAWNAAVDMALRRGLGYEDARRILIELASGREVHIARGPRGTPMLALGEL